MSLSTNLGLHLTSASETNKLFIEWRQELCGDSASSNMNIIDSEFGKIKNKVVWSESQPTNQIIGDTWNKILA